MSQSIASGETLSDRPTVLDIEPGRDIDSPVLEPGQRIGPYRIEHLLGEGGMGAVYLARQLEPIERAVALKLIRGQLRGGLAEAYFLVERQALARMEHPAIAKVFDAGTTPQGHLFFAMEWIDGETLSNYCAHHHLSERDKLVLFTRICMGVQHAHQKGVIHRDLKPGNVLITMIDGLPMPKIIDFGVATSTDDRRPGCAASIGQSVGTHGYMSPEQVRGDPGEIDVRTDIYSLGVILLELLAPPGVLQQAVAAGLDNEHVHSALLTSLGEQANGNVDSHTVRGLSQIPESLRWLLARALNPLRTLRYDSAQMLADEVDSYLQDYPLLAVPPTRRYRLRCFAARNRVALSASALIALALIAGTTAAVIGMVNARTAAARAHLEAQKSEQTARFLTDVLSGVDPEQARDLDKTLLHLVLDRAAARASRELASQPEVLATIEGTIASSYSSLSEYKKALEHSRRAYAAALASVGPDALLALRIQRQIARALDATGEGKQAIALLETNIAALRRTRGAEDRDTIRSLLQAAETSNASGNFTGAENYLAAVLPIVDRIAGNDGDLVIHALEAHAVTLTYQGRFKQAEPVFRDAIARSTERHGLASPQTLDLMNEFAIMYLETNRFAEGADVLQKILPVDEKLYGRDHSATMNVVSNLAGALRQQGTPEKVAASGPLYKRAYEFMLGKYGKQHPNTIIATGNYGNYLLDVGEVGYAIELERTALAGSQQQFGERNNITGEMHFQLANALARNHQYAEAEPHYLAAITEKQADFGVDHWRIGGYIDPLITLYKDWDKPERAAQWQGQKDALQPKADNG